MSRIVFWGLVTLVVLSPLPLASNRPLPWSALGLCTGILLVLWSLVAMRRRAHGAKTADRFFIPVAFVFLFALGWMLWQSLGPMPAEWQPEALRRAAAVLGESTLSSGIGLDSGAAWHVLMRLATYGGVFLLAWEFGRTRERAQTMLMAIVAAGVCYAIYGLVIQLGEYRMVLWFPKTAYEGLTSTFINRNSYATYAAIGLLCALALMFSEWRQRANSDRGTLSADRAPPRGGRDLRIGLLAMAAGLIATALIMTGSRGGFYGLAFTLAACTGLLALARILRGRQLLAVVGLGFLAAIAVMISVGGSLAGRFESGLASVETSRGDIFRPTIDAIRERPLTGYGAGSFQGVYEAVNTGELYRQGYSIDKAHNTYLELALEAGIPATLAMIASIFSFAALCALALLRRRGVRFALAGIAASLMVAFHAIVDFSLQMPAVAVTYAAVLGACAAQSLRRLSERN